MALFDRVKEIIIEELVVSDGIVTADAALGVGDGIPADSLDLVELVMALEEEFDVEIPEKDAERLRTPGDIVRYLEKRGIEE